jgi:hypothetical protein
MLTPAPSSAPLPGVPIEDVPPSPALPATAGGQAAISPSTRHPSLSPRAAQELADAITRLDDPATTTNRRSFRQRTSLQLNPYTRERAAYRHLLARGGLEAAIVQRREELGAQSGGAAADGSFVPPPEKEPAAPGAKAKGKGRVLSDEDRRLLETFGGPLPADEDDELDLLASVGQMGGGELARWEEAVRRRKAEAKAKERKDAKKTKAGIKAFPMDLGQAQKENRAVRFQIKSARGCSFADHCVSHAARQVCSSTGPARQHRRGGRRLLGLRHPPTLRAHRLALTSATEEATETPTGSRLSVASL